MPTHSGVLTRKQQWRRVGCSSMRRSAIDKQGASNSHCGGCGESPRIFESDPAAFRRGCLRPLGMNLDRSASWPRRESTHPTYAGGSMKYLEAAATNGDLVDSGSRCGANMAPSPLSANSRRSSANEVPADKVGQPRVVHFDRCVRVVLVPSRRDLDAATAQGVWWDQADVRGFRCAAYQFYKKHGKLTGVTDEELEEADLIPCVPPPMSAPVDDADVAGGVGGCDDGGVGDSDDDDNGALALLDSSANTGRRRVGERRLASVVDTATKEGGRENNRGGAEITNEGRRPGALRTGRASFLLL